MAKRASFSIGQVVAYRRNDEIIYRYGRINFDMGLIYVNQMKKQQGFAIVDGVQTFTIAVRRMRPLTIRERGRTPKSGRELLEILRVARDWEMSQSR